MNENNLNLVCQEAVSYGHEFKGHLFEQYKLYVEMADRVSSRRILVNPFFVDVHKILVTVFTVLLKEQILQSSLLGILPFLSVSLLCFSLVASRVFLPATQHGKIQGHHCIGSNAADSALMTRHGLRSAREKTENFIFRSLIFENWCRPVLVRCTYYWPWPFTTKGRPGRLLEKNGSTIGGQDGSGTKTDSF